MMLSTPKISVIVPIYKVEKYLQECINSILNQTFTEFELILVNDGSPDSCKDICNINAKQDTRILVIHQENQGVTRARANGVAASKGEFITFVDGDDTLLPHAFKTLYNSASDDIDIVIGKYENMPCPPRGIITANKYKELCILLKDITGSPVAKLYRKYLFDSQVFHIPAEVKYGEDAIMNIRISYKLKTKAYSTDTLIYNYRNNPNSAVHLYKTPEIIALYLKYRMASITHTDIKNLLPKGLADAIISSWCSSTCSRIFIPSSTKQTHQYLLSIKKYATQKFGIISGLLFKHNNPFIRAILILIKIIKHSIKSTFIRNKN